MDFKIKLLTNRSSIVIWRSSFLDIPETISIKLPGRIEISLIIQKTNCSIPFRKKDKIQEYIDKMEETEDDRIVGHVGINFTMS